MKIRLSVLLLLAVSSTLVSGYDSGIPDSTHRRLTGVLFDTKAPANLAPLVLNRDEYPDIYKFKQAILDGSDSELSHSDPADASILYWYDSEGLWENYMRDVQYPNRTFASAYTSIGYYLHMTQDSTVPAHDRVIFHGPPILYRLAPGGPILDGTKYPSAREDGLETAAVTYDFATLPVVNISLAEFHASVGAWSNAPQRYDNPGTPSCENVLRKLWLCDGEIASPDSRDDYVRSCSARKARTWGVYSFPTARGCDYPPIGGDLDWFPRRLSATGEVEAPQSAHAIGRTAVYLAIRLGAEALKRLSKSLPPVVTTPLSPILVDFAGGQTASFALLIQDNRTPVINLTIRDAATRRVIRATASAPGLKPTLADVDGTLKIPLGRQPDSDRTVLPWADHVTISWAGRLAGAAGRIRPGRQTLEVEVRDEDGHTAKGTVLVGSGDQGRPRAGGHS